MKISFVNLIGLLINEKYGKIYIILDIFLTTDCIPQNCWQTQLMMEQVEELRRKVHMLY